MTNLKRLFTLVLAIGFVSFGSAQEKFWVGLDLGFNSSKVGDGDAVNTYELSPTLGYQINDKMGIGVNLGFGSEGEDQSNFGLGAFLRYGFNIGDKATLFGDLGVGFASASDKSGAEDVTVTGFNVGISPGFLYRFADKWSAVAHFGSLGFSSLTPKVGDTEGDANTNFGLNLNMSTIGIGVQYHF